MEITHIRDAAIAQSAFDFFDQDLLSLRSGEAAGAEQVVLRLEGANLIYYSTDVRVRTRPKLHGSHMGFVVFGPRSTGTVNGLPVRSDLLLCVPTGHSISMVAEPGNESAGFLVPREDLAVHLGGHGREDVLEALQRVEMRQLEPGRANRLFEWAKRLVESAKIEPDLFEASTTRRAGARYELMEILAATLAASCEIELKQRDRTRLMQSHIVRAAEQYALAHCGKRLFVKDLCQAAGVSERTLEYAFRAEMGLTPVAYLARVRLHKVREALSGKTGTPTSVSNEAVRWGFWNFSDFARSYRECFQELPSETLRRALAY